MNDAVSKLSALTPKAYETVQVLIDLLHDGHSDILNFIWTQIWTRTQIRIEPQ